MTYINPRTGRPLGKDWRKSGEAKLFKEILTSRGSKSEISGTPIKNVTDSNYIFIIPKSHYRRFRLREDNVLIVTHVERLMYGNGDSAKLKADAKWKWVFEKAEALKEEYSKLTKSRR